MLAKRLIGSHLLDEMMPRKLRLAAVSTAQNGGNNVDFWASLGTDFIGKTCTLETETSVSGQTYCKVYISADKYIYMFLE